MVATAERFLPKLILIENVPGFVRANSGLARFTEQLEAMEERTGVHYNLTSTTLHAEEFGVPQRRQRSFVVGVRDDIKRSFAWPSPVPESEWRRAGDALAKLKIADSLQMKGTWAELLPSIPAGKNYLFHTKSGGGVALFGERTRFWSFLLKTDPRLPSWTLPASPGPATGPFHWESRPFAVEEMARLQTFPASWRFEGSRQLAVKQVGNAAPPLLIEHVGRALTKLLRAQIPTELVHRLEKAARIPSPPEPTPVHERYAHLRGEHARHKGTGKGPQPRKDAVG
jgi:DNA (cytosine-5)-methyltransferase 1